MLHQLRDAILAISNSLLQNTRYERDSFDTVEFDAPSKSLLSQRPGLVQKELFSLAGKEVHEGSVERAGT